MPSSPDPTPIRWAAALALAGLVLALVNFGVQVVGVATAASDSELAVDLDPPVVLGSGDPVATIVLEDPGTRAQIAHRLPDLVVAAVIAVGLGLVFRIFRRSRAGRPFARANGTDLRWIAVLLAVSGPAVALVGDLAHRVVADAAPVLPVVAARTPSATISVFTVMAVGVWALSTIFSYGADLAEDAEVTI